MRPKPSAKTVYKGKNLRRPYFKSDVDSYFYRDTFTPSKSTSEDSYCPLKQIYPHLEDRHIRIIDPAYVSPFN